MHMIHCRVGVDLIGLDLVNSCVFMRVLHCSEDLIGQDYPVNSCVLMRVSKDMSIDLLFQYFLLL